MIKLFKEYVDMKTLHKVAFGSLFFLLSCHVANAEDYVGVGLGWVIDAKLSSIKGNENINYPDPAVQGTLFQGTTYSSLDLKKVLQGGVRYGHFFESNPSFGIELEGNYSQPNMKKQNVTINNAGIGDAISYASSDQLPVVDANSFIENQFPAKVQLLQFNLNAIYRYQGFKGLVPYVGAGPSLNFVRITGTGLSGVFVDPSNGELVPSGTCIIGTPCSNVHDSSFNIGLNFKVGAEYKFDDAWGLGAEYRYNWVPIDISNFRSASNLDADLKMQTVSVILTRHF